MLECPEIGALLYCDVQCFRGAQSLHRAVRKPTRTLLQSQIEHLNYIN